MQNIRANHNLAERERIPTSNKSGRFGLPERSSIYDVIDNPNSFKALEDFKKQLEKHGVNVTNKIIDALDMVGTRNVGSIDYDPNSKVINLNHYKENKEKVNDGKYYFTGGAVRTIVTEDMKVSNNAEIIEIDLKEDKEAKDILDKAKKIKDMNGPGNDYATLVFLNKMINDKYGNKRNQSNKFEFQEETQVIKFENSEQVCRHLSALGIAITKELDIKNVELMSGEYKGGDHAWLKYEYKGKMIIIDPMNHEHFLTQDDDDFWEYCPYKNDDIRNNFKMVDGKDIKKSA